MKVKDLVVALQKMDGEYQIDNAFKIGDEIHLRFSLEKFEPPKETTNDETPSVELSGRENYD